MKYNPNKKQEQLGESRIKRKLLILPLALKGDGRYLEIAYINQQYQRNYVEACCQGGYCGYKYEWVNISFVTKKAYKNYKELMRRN